MIAIGDIGAERACRTSALGIPARSAGSSAPGAPTIGSEGQHEEALWRRQRRRDADDQRGKLAELNSGDPRHEFLSSPRRVVPDYAGRTSSEERALLPAADKHEL